MLVPSQEVVEKAFKLLIDSHSQNTNVIEVLAQLRELRKANLAPFESNSDFDMGYLLGIAVALILACLAFATYDSIVFRNSLARDLETRFF